MNRHIRIDRQKKSFINKIKKKIESDKGFCSEEDIREAIEFMGEDAHKMMRINKCERSSFDHTCELIVKQDSGLKEVEWSDFKVGIIQQIEKFFKEYPDTEEFKAKNMSCRIYKILIKDYLLPKCENIEGKTLGQIAEQVGLTEGRLSQMVHGERMKRFMEIAFH